MEQILLAALGLTALVVALLLITAAAAVALLTFVFGPYDDVPLDDDSQG
jgi:hypothetical protein